jgi:hypothetical protein
MNTSTRRFKKKQLTPEQRQIAARGDRLSRIRASAEKTNLSEDEAMSLALEAQRQIRTRS